MSIRDLVTVTVNAATTTLAAPVAIGPGTTSSPIPTLTTNTPTFTWNGVSGVTGYQINLHNSTANTTTSYQVGASVTSYTLAAGVLVAGDTYAWNVRGLNGTQSGPPSANLSFQAEPAATSLPVVTGVAPSSGPTTGGTVVTITGTNFTGASSVTFGTVYAASFTVNSSTSITATTPAESAGNVDVHVVTAAGLSAGSTADKFTFASAALSAPTAVSVGTAAQPGPVLSTAPVLQWSSVASVTGYQISLTDLTLNKVSTFSVGASVNSYTIGTDVMAAGDKFVWNVHGVNGSVSGPSSNSLYFQTPSRTSLPVPVVIGPGSTTSPGSSLTTLTPTFTWHAVTGTINGYQLHLYDSTAAKYLSYDISPTATSFTLPAGAISAGDQFVWNLRVISGGVTGPESAYLYFHTVAATASPSVSSVTPSSGSTAGGTVVTISGSNFTGVSTVRFGTVNATSFKINSATSITATAPAEGAGTVDILVSGSGGASTAATTDRFTFVAPVTLPAPVITSPQGPTSPGSVVTSLTPTFTWNAVAGVSGYQINIYDETLKKTVSYQISGAAATSFTIPSSAPLTAGDTFIWNVRVLSNGQSGTPSAYWYFQTPAGGATSSAVSATSEAASTSATSQITATPVATVSGPAVSSALTTTLSGKLPAAAITAPAINVHQTITLDNTTGSAIHGAAHGKLYLSSGTTLDSNSILVATSSAAIRLKPGKHASFRVKLRKLPANVPNGVYHLVMQITDPTGATSQAASAGTLTVART